VIRPNHAHVFDEFQSVKNNSRSEFFGVFVVLLFKIGNYPVGNLTVFVVRHFAWDFDQNYFKHEKDRADLSRFGRRLGNVGLEGFLQLVEYFSESGVEEVVFGSLDDERSPLGKSRFGHVPGVLTQAEKGGSRFSLEHFC